MNFLIPFLKDRPSNSSINAYYSSNEEPDPPEENITKPIQSESIVHKSIEDIIEKPIPVKKRIKILQPITKDPTITMKYPYKGKHKEPDEIEILFYSFAQTVKRMDPYHRAVAKSKVCSIITELEIQSLTKSGVTSDPSPSVTYASCSSSNASTPVPSPLPTPNIFTQIKVEPTSFQDALYNCEDFLKEENWKKWYIIKY